MTEFHSIVTKDSFPPSHVEDDDEVLMKHVVRQHSEFRWLSVSTIDNIDNKNSMKSLD